MSAQKKKFQMPTTCALLFMLMIVCAIMTWIIPAGAYDMVKVGKLNKVVPGTYHVIASAPQGPWALVSAVVQGCIKASKLMFMTMFCGGAVELLQKTGSIEAAFSKISSKKNLNTKVLVFAIMLFMSIGGAAGVFANPVVALIPIGIILAKSLGYDAFTGFLLVYMGAYSGFNVGGFNPSSVGTAQSVAELPIFSGLFAREVIHVINFIMCYLFTLKYMAHIKKDPTHSLNYEEGLEPSQYMGMSSMEAENGSQQKEIVMTAGHTISLIALVGAIICILIGSTKFKWSFNEISTSFFVVSLITGFANKLSINETTKTFIAGVGKMANASLIIGFANGVGIILTNGKIFSTIVYWMCIPLSMFGPVIGANLMFVANLLLNFLIPSGSGQAVAVMPLMTPVADLIGITRQVAVSAFQFGDGFSNCIFPTAGTLMGSLAIAKVDWLRYAKWFLPWIGAQCVLSVIALTVLQLMGWTGL